MIDAPQLWQTLVIAIGQSTGMPDSVLHLNAGLAIFVLARVVTRRTLGGFVPLAAVLVAEFVNEVLDYLANGWREDTLTDAAWTLFWPVAIMLAVRWRPADRGATAQ